MSVRRASIAAALALLACTGTRPADVGVHAGALRPCPSTPNCVSSDAGDPPHHVAAFELLVPAADAWPAAVRAVEGVPRTVVVARTDEFLHAECTSRIFRFVDDLELHLRSAEGVIAVRSASRLGRGDMGVNRARVESLRAALVEQGIVRGEAAAR
jgi:uncharacterized protein (DUF1499 family)